MTGGPGSDVLIGGPGHDQFCYNGDDDLDRILDFETGIDKIALSSIQYLHGVVIELVQSEAPVALTADSTFLYNVINGILSYDADGVGAAAAVQISQLNTGLTLAVNDFIFF